MRLRQWQYGMILAALAISLSGCGSSKNKETSSAAVTSAVAVQPNGSGGPGGRGNPGGPGGGGRGGFNVDKSADTQLQDMISEVKDQYRVLSYEDAETGKTLTYNLFVPENYDASERYPLILFIPDSSLVGKGPEAALTQGYGGIIWATKEEQEKHPGFVLVPTYDEVLTTDNWETGEGVEMTVRLIKALEEEYSIDQNRLYVTGQSMGCMTTMYLNIQYPDLFAASLFVGGQWDEEALKTLADQSFFYIVAQGDPKASAGMAALKPALDDAGAKYSQAVWDAKWSEAEFDRATEALLSEGNQINFVEFEEGSVLPDGVEIGVSEHMYSFDYAYQITAVRDWLFAQTK